MHILSNPYSDKKYDEEPQQLDIRFAFITKTLPDTYTTLHNFVKCRDFLSDAIFWWQNDQQNKSVYRFSVEQLNLITPNLAVKGSEQHIKTLIENCAWGTLGQIMAEPTKDKEIALITLPNHAISNPSQISFYSLLLKLATIANFKHNEQFKILDNENLPDKERDYLNIIGTDFFLYLYQHQSKLYYLPHKFIDPTVYKWSDSQIHEYLGIVSLFKKHSPDSIAKQYYLKLKQQFKNDNKNKNKNTPNRNNRAKYYMAAINPNNIAVNPQINNINMDDIAAVQVANAEVNLIVANQHQGQQAMNWQANALQQLDHEQHAPVENAEF